MIKSIGIKHVLLFHKKIIDKTGGGYAVRDIGIIESALNRAFYTFDGEELYKNILEKIAAITYSLIKNHGFLDGNKRIGVATMLLLLKLIQIEIKYSQDELIKLGVNTAAGIFDQKEVLKWLTNHVSEM